MAGKTLGILTERQNKIRLFAVLVAILIAVLYSVNLILFIISLGLMYKVISPMLSRDIFNSYFIKAFLCLFIYIILLQSVILTAWLFIHTFSLAASIPISLIIIIIILSIFSARHGRQRQSISMPTLPLLHSFDIIALILACLIALPIVSHALTRENGNFTTNFRLIGAGSDDENHLKLFDARVKHDRGILYQSDTVEQYYGGEIYPAGWHSANVAITKAVDPHVVVGSDSRVDYIFSKLFWFFALLVIFCRVTMTISKKLIKNKLPLMATVWLFIGMYIFGRIFVANVYEAGAYSFVPILISALLSILLLLQLSENRIHANGRRDSLFLLIMVLIGASLSWVLVLPALIATIVAILIIQRKDKDIGMTVRHLFTRVPYCIPLYLLALAWIIQLYVMLNSRSEGSVSFIQGIVQGGGIMVNEIDFYVFVITGVLATIGILYKKYHRYYTYILWALIPLFVFDQLLSILQLITVGENRYYYYKVLNLITITLLPLCIVGFTFLINWLESKKLKLIEACLFLMLFGLSSIFLMRDLLHIF